MVKDARVYATPKQTIDIAIKLYKQNISPEDAILYLKSEDVKGISYFGIAVANHMQLLYRLNNGIKAGKIKATKTKGLVLP